MINSVKVVLIISTNNWNVVKYYESYVFLNINFIVANTQNTLYSRILLKRLATALPRIYLNPLIIKLLQL